MREEERVNASISLLEGAREAFALFIERKHLEQVFVEGKSRRK